MPAPGASPLTPEETAVADTMQRAHLAAAHELPDLFEQHAASLGVDALVTYLVDLQQAVLVPFVPRRAPRADEQLEPLRVDSTLAGRAFQQGRPVTQELADDEGRSRVWLPLVDGTERLGVMAVTASAALLEDESGALWGRLRLLAAVAAELVVSKTAYGDTLVRLRRSTEMGLAAEMQWALLPPLTFSTSAVTLAGGLEPAYEVAGDSIDYAVDDRVAHFAVFDGMGHGLGSAQLATLTVAAYRNGRRGGRSLATTAHDTDTAVDQAFAGGSFITAVLAELDTESGLLRWVNAGHPDPLLLRDGKLVKELHTEPALPLGLSSSLDHAESVEVGSEGLEPGDIVVLYTDGVVEARSPGGEFFGVDRMVDLLTRNLASGLPAAETVRRIVRALLDHQQDRLDDDATLMFVQWRPPDPMEMLP